MMALIRARAWPVGRHWLVAGCSVLGSLGLVLPFVAPRYPVLTPVLVGVWVVVVPPSFVVSYPVLKGYALLQTAVEVGCLVVFLLGWARHPTHPTPFHAIGLAAMAFGLMLAGVTALLFAD